MRLVALVTVASLWVCACSGGDASPDDSVSKLIGPEGGTVELPGGGKLEIPAGALSEAVSFKVTKLELDDVASLPSNLEAAGKPYAFEPFEVAFSAPVKLEVPFDGAAAEVRPMKLPTRSAATTAWTTVFPNEKVADKVSLETTSLGVILAARPRRGSGVITLPDGAVVPEDAGTMDSSAAGVGGAGGDGGVGGSGGMDAAVMDAAMDDDAGFVYMGPRWIWQFGTSAGDMVAGMVVDAEDNTIVVGDTQGSFPGFTNGGGAEAFVRKMNAAGTVLWTRQFGGTSATGTSANAVTVDAAGNVFVAGTVASALPGQVGAGNHDAFVRKYDSAGNEVWTHQFGGLSTDHAEGVALDADGNVFVAGSVASALPGQTHVGNWDGFVRKLDSEGNELWTRQYGTAVQDLVKAVAVDGTGSVYTVGGTSRALGGQVAFGSTDAYVRKYDSAGTLQWTRQFGTAEWDDLEGVAIDGDGRVVVAGYTGGALPGLTSAGGTDVMVRVYDSSGVEQWTTQYGSSGADYGRAMALDPVGNVLVSGYTLGAFEGFTSAGGRDAFITQVDSGGNVGLTHQFGTPADDESYALTAALDGTPVVGGHTQGALPGNVHAGARDGFVARLGLLIE